jgi:hypothetical protein
MKKKKALLGKEDILGIVFIVLFVVTFLPMEPRIKIIPLLLLIIIPFFMEAQVFIFYTLFYCVIIYSATKNVTSTHFTSFNIVGFGFIFALLMGLIFVILKTIYGLNKMEKPKVENHRLKIGFKVNSLLFNIRFIYPIVAFISLIVCIIFSFGSIYYNYNKCFDPVIVSGIGDFVKNNSQWQLVSGFSEDIPSKFNAIYFSFTTFFTIGYGDIKPVANVTKLIAMIEMFLSYFITCMFIPVLFSAFSKYLKINK